MRAKSVNAKGDERNAKIRMGCAWGLLVLAVMTSVIFSVFYIVVITAGIF